MSYHLFCIYLQNLVTGSKDSDYKKECLAAHNEYRKQHHVPALKLNEKMCKEAQAWAQNLAVQDKMEHANTEDGENIFSFWSSKPEYTIHGKFTNSYMFYPISIFTIFFQEVLQQTNGIQKYPFMISVENQVI